jgi:hypothetical protein
VAQVIECLPTKGQSPEFKPITEKRKYVMGQAWWPLLSVIPATGEIEIRRIMV